MVTRKLRVQRNDHKWQKVWAMEKYKDHRYFNGWWSWKVAGDFKEDWNFGKEKEIFIKWEFVVEVFGTNDKKVKWEVVIFHILVEEKDNKHIVLRGFDFKLIVIMARYIYNVLWGYLFFNGG